MSVISKRCDGVTDCDTDEVTCPPVCGRGQFPCNDGSCIDMRYRCNRVPDCQDMTDEIGTVKLGL